ncbi:MAG: superfamily II DNA helicase RecQ, partial [Flavobacteriales bacterium]
ECRTNFIARYFGDKPKQPCGHCDVCRSEKKQEHTLPNALRNLLRAGDAHLVDVVHTLNEFNKRDVIDLIDMYIDEKRISRNEDDILHWMTADS